MHTYSDYFYYLTSIKKEFSPLSLCSLKNFFNFFKFFSYEKNKFIVLDYNQFYNNMFNNLLFSNSDLIKYNYFFKLNLKLLKYQHFSFAFNKVLQKLNINMVVVLDYSYYYLYFQYFNFLSVVIFSFVNNPILVSNLDFYYFYKKNYFFLEKIIFVSKVLQIWNYNNNLKIVNKIMKL